MARNTVALSLPQSETVRGYEIRRLPLGGYLAALEELRRAPGNPLAACFPGKTPVQALDALRAVDKDDVAALCVRALCAMPQEAVRLLSALTGVKEDALLDDPNVGLDGAAEMAEAFFRLNRIENFMEAVGRLAAGMKAAGSSA